jgi:hypothetical protein
MEKLLLGCLLALLAATAAPAAAPRFLPYAGEWRYGLTLAPPWAEGGLLEINSPEHLARYPDTQGILRYYDTTPPRWQVSADGKRASLDADSATMPGVHVRGTGKVVSSSRLEFTMEITNHTDQTLEGIVPLYCFHYRTLTGFPQWQGNFAHTFVLLGGKVTPLASVTTSKPDTNIKGGYMRGNPQRDSDDFPAQYGGLVAEPFDAGVIAVTSLDGKRALLLAWTPAKSILSNGSIPCLHADPYYGPIASGQSVARRGLVVFTEEPVEKAMRKLVKEGWGAPVVTPPHKHN